eukprot:tig00020554_g10937.t1
MSNEQMKEFGRLASSGNVREGQRNVRPSLVDPLEGSRFHMTSEFSRFGIGAKSAIFFFGPLLKLTSKVEDSLTVYRLNMDLREIQQRRQHVARFEQALANADELEVGSFTHIEISEVNPGVLDSWNTHKTAIIRFLAETYHFYLHGGFKLNPERLVHDQAGEQPMQLAEALRPLKLSVVEYEGKQELARLALPYALSQLEHPPAAIASEVKAAIENEVRVLHGCLHPVPGAATAAGDDWPRQGDPRLRWEKTYTVQYVDEKTSSRRSVEVTVVLKYFPVAKNRETVPDTGLGDREGPKVYTVWQGRSMAQATLTNNKKWLAWMDKPGRRSRELPFECWPRIRGFLFLSSEFEPQSHKTQMAVNPAAFKALIADEYEELRREFRARVKEWHKFDDEVSCPERFSGDFKEPRTKKVIGRTLDFVKLGKTTYKPGHRVKARYDREKVSGAASILFGTIKAIYVEGAPASQEGPEPSDVPWVSFEQMSLREYGEPRLLKIAATDLVGMPSKAELSKEEDRLQRRLPKSLRFSTDAGAVPERLRASGGVELLGVEAVDQEGRRLDGPELARFVPAVHLVLYLRAADARVEVDGVPVKRVSAEGLGELPESLRRWRVDGEEYVANIHLKNVARDNDLYYFKRIQLKHAGSWKLRALAVACGGGEKGAVALSDSPHRIDVARSITVLPDGPVQVEAAWHGDGAGFGRVGEPLPGVAVLLEDANGNLPVEEPPASMVASVSFTCRDKSFEVLPGFTRKLEKGPGGRYWLLLGDIRFRVREGAQPAMPAPKVPFLVQFGPARNPHSTAELALEIRAGAPPRDPRPRLPRPPHASAQGRRRGWRRARVAAGAGGRGGEPALLERSAVIPQLKIRLVDKDGLAADVRQAASSSSARLRVRLSVEGARVPSGLKWDSRLVPASGELDYGGRIEVIGNYGSEGLLAFAIEGGDEAGRLELPFRVAPRRLRVLLPKRLPPGATRDAKRKPPAAAAAAGSSSSGGEKRRRGKSDEDAMEEDEDEEEGEEEEGEEGEVGRKGKGEDDEEGQGACRLRVRHGTVLSGLAVQLVDERGRPDKSVSGEPLELSWDPSQSRKFQNGRATLPDIRAWELPPAGGSGGGEGEGQGARACHVAFAGLRADLSFSVFWDAPQRLRGAREGPLPVQNRQPASLPLLLLAASGDPVPSSAFAQSAHLELSLEEGSPLALEVDPAGLAVAPEEAGALRVSGWRLRGPVDLAGGEASLRVTVLRSEPALPPDQRAFSVPLALSAGPPARLAVVGEDGAELASPLELHNGAALPRLAVRAVDEDGSVAASAAGAVHVEADEALQLAGPRLPVRIPSRPASPPPLLRASLRDRSRLREAGVHSIRFALVPAGASAVRRRPAASAARPVRRLAAPLLPARPERGGRRWRGGGGGAGGAGAERAERVVLRLPPGGLACEAGALLPDIPAEVLSETGAPLRLPAGALLALHVHASRYSPDEAPGEPPGYVFREVPAPREAIRHALRCEVLAASGAPDASVAPPPATSPSVRVRPGPPPSPPLCSARGPRRRAGAPHALRMAAEGGATRLQLGTGAALPSLALELLDRFENPAPAPAGPPLRLAYSVSGSGGAAEGAAPQVAAAAGPAAWPAGHASVVLAGLTIGDGASGTYELRVSVEGLPGVAPAAIHIDFTNGARGPAPAPAPAGLLRAARGGAGQGAGGEEEGGGGGCGGGEAGAGGGAAGGGAAAGRGPDEEALAGLVRGRREEAAALQAAAASGAGGGREANGLRMRDAGLQRFMATVAQSPPRGFLGFVFSLLRVDDDREAEALACFLGPNAQTAVFQEDRDARSFEQNNWYSGLRILALGSLTDDAFLPASRVDPASPQQLIRFSTPAPPGSSYLINRVQLADPSLRRTLVWYLVRDTLCVESLEERHRLVDEHWRGKQALNVVVLPRVDGAGRVDPASVRVFRRNAIRRTGPPEPARVTLGRSRTAAQEAAERLAEVGRQLEALEAVQRRREEAARAAAAQQRAEAEAAAAQERARALEKERDAAEGELRALAGQAPRGTVAGPSAGTSASGPGGTKRPRSTDAA